MEERCWLSLTKTLTCSLKLICSIKMRSKFENVLGTVSGGKKGCGFKRSIIGKCYGPFCVWLFTHFVKSLLLRFPKHVKTSL